MPPTSVCNQVLKHGSLSVRSGYSLIEVLVVVAILAVVVTIAGPSLTRLIARQEAQSTLRGIGTELSSLRVEAYVSVQDIPSSEVARRVQTFLPERWASDVEDQVLFRASGYCRGGRVTVFEPSGRPWILHIRDGDCRAELTPATD